MILQKNPVAITATEAAAVFGVVWGFFAWLERFPDDDIRKEVADWLLDSTPFEKPVNWIKTFGRIFDSVFGKNHFSWKCFSRSSVITLIIAVLMVLVPEKISDNNFSFESVLLVFMANFIPDYVSLLKSRAILRLLAKGKPLRALYLIPLDVFLCLICGMIAAIFMHMMAEIPYLGGQGNYSQAGEAVLAAVHLAPINGMFDWIEPAILTIFCLTPAFFTLFWTLSYLISGLCVKGLFGIQVVYEWIIIHSQVKQTPISIIGLMCAILVTCLFLITDVILGFL